MKLTETQEKVLAFIGKFSDSTADAIAQGTGVQKLQVYKTVKYLSENGMVTITTENGTPTYKAVKGEGKSEKKTKASDEVYLKTGNRDTSKLKFQGQEYGKGQLVLAVVKAHVEKNPRMTLSKLREIFPDELQPRYGTIQEVSKAKKLSSDRDRFFLKPEQILKVGDKKVAVSNQWGSNNLPPFLKVAKSLGYHIK